MIGHSQCLNFFISSRSESIAEFESQGETAQMRRETSQGKGGFFTSTQKRKHAKSPEVARTDIRNDSGYTQNLSISPSTEWLIWRFT